MVIIVVEVAAAGASAAAAWIEAVVYILNGGPKNNKTVGILMEAE